MASKTLHADRSALPRPGGWTLLETLITVSIVGLLAGLLTPCLTAAIEYAKSAICQTNLAHLGRGVHAFRAAARPSRPPSAADWAHSIRPYLPGEEVFVCPCDTDPSELLWGMELLYLRVYGYEDLSRIRHDIYLFDEHPVHQTRTGPHQVVEKHNVSADGRQYELWIENLEPYRADWDWDIKLRITHTDDGLSATILPGSHAGSRHHLFRGETLLLPDYVKSYERQGREVTLLEDAFPGSYGMNNQVGPRSDAGQLMLLDYRRWVADSDGGGNQDDDLDRTLAPRHLGRANIAAISGAVRSCDPIDLADDRAIWKAGP